MNPRNVKVKRVYDFFVDRFENDELFSKEDIRTASGWKLSTVKTYLNKNYWNEYIEKVDHIHYRIVNFEDVTFEAFLACHTQVK